ncbi:hypothetical protein JST97_07870 [bacterium]|nr:hypothetical protein [bacterium]
MQRLERWMAGYRLPPVGDPLHEVESANLEVLRSFYALLAVTGQEPDPLTAVRAHFPDFPEFALDGSPSEALVVLGVARPRGPLVDLKARLQEQLSPEQAAEYLTLID